MAYYYKKANASELIEEIKGMLDQLEKILNKPSEAEPIGKHAGKEEVCTCTHHDSCCGCMKTNKCHFCGLPLHLQTDLQKKCDCNPKRQRWDRERNCWFCTKCGEDI